VRARALLRSIVAIFIYPFLFRGGFEAFPHLAQAEIVYGTGIHGRQQGHLALPHLAPQTQEEVPARQGFEPGRTDQGPLAGRGAGGGGGRRGGRGGGGGPGAAWPPTPPPPP